MLIRAIALISLSLVLSASSCSSPSSTSSSKSACLSAIDAYDRVLNDQLEALDDAQYYGLPYDAAYWNKRADEAKRFKIQQCGY